MKKIIICAAIITALAVTTACFSGCNNSSSESSTSSSAQEVTTDLAASELNIEKTAAKQSQLGEITEAVEAMEDKYDSGELTSTDISDLCDKLLDLQLSVNSGETEKDEALKSTVKYAADFVNKIDIDNVKTDDKEKTKILIDKCTSVLTSIKTDLGIIDSDTENAIEIIADSQQINVGKTMQLSIGQTSDDILTFEWSSDDEDVLTVDSDGIIEGIKEGTATITLKSNDGRTAFKKFEVIGEDDQVVTIARENPDKYFYYQTIGGNTKTVDPPQTTPSEEDNASQVSPAQQADDEPQPQQPAASSGSSSAPASSSKVWHEAVYKYVDHPAETKEVYVVDTPASSYEEPVYEEKERCICNDCGADLTDMSDSEMTHHLADHARNGGHGSWRSVWQNVQVGTKTVNVPEQGHYETQTVKDAYTEKVLVSEGYWA